MVSPQQVISEGGSFNPWSVSCHNDESAVVSVLEGDATTSMGYLHDDLLNCEILECEPLVSLAHRQLDEDPEMPFSGDFVKPPKGVRQVSEVADRVESKVAEVPKLPAKKPRRQSCPGPLKDSRSLGMNYEIKNWDILCGRGRGKLPKHQ